MTGKITLAAFAVMTAFQFSLALEKNMIPIILDAQPKFAIVLPQNADEQTKAAIARLQAFLQQKYHAKLPEDAQSSLPKILVNPNAPSFEPRDYRISFQNPTQPSIEAGSAVALERALDTLVTEFAAATDFAVPQGTDIHFKFAEQRLDNFALLPKYRYSKDMKLEPSDAEGKLMTPDWVKSMVLVEIHLETASLGRTFNKALPLLDHYASLGVNALWLCPVYEKGPGGNGYGNQGVHRLEPAYAETTDQQAARQSLRRLVDQAHQRNIHILLDIITWGAMTNCQLIKDHPDWFSGKAWGNEAFNWKNPEFVEWFIQNTVDLVLATDIDGFRCDCEPNHAGYKNFAEIRKRLAQKGKHIIAIAEDCNDRQDAFDMEQDGVLDYSKMHRGQLYQNPVNFFADGLLDIVDSCKNGKGLGPANLQNDEAKRGTFRFYPNCITNHDYQQRNVCGDRLKINYAAVLAPFIPIWFQGDEFGLTSRKMVIYHQETDYNLANQPANAFFMEDVKKALAIRRQFRDIFEYFPINHRETNICKTEVDGLRGLTAYARFANGKAVIVVPNPSKDAYGDFTVKLPVQEAGLAMTAATNITDLLHDRPITMNQGTYTFNAVIPPRHVGVYLVSNENPQAEQKKQLMDNISTPLDDIELQPGEFAWYHLGQQGFLLKLGKTVISVDAYLTPSKARQIPPLLFPAQYKKVAAALGTHDHSDHIDRPLWPKLAAANPDLKFIIPADVFPQVQKATQIAADRFVGLTDGTSVTIGDVKITAIPSAHEFLDRNPQTGNYPYLGYIIEGNGVRIYHAGDTCVYEGMLDRLRRFCPLDAVMLPINGRDARRLGGNCIGNMTFQEAADLAGAIRPRLSIPAHFDMFKGNTENPQLFIDYMKIKYPSLATTIPVPGEVHHVKAFTPERSCTPRTKIENDCYDWFERHKEKCEAAKKHCYDIVLMGDSITHFWETLHGPESWKRLFANRDVLNLGFGWDRTCNLIYRLENGEFANQKPKVFVLHIGTNNLTQTANYPGDTPEQVVKGILSVVEHVQAASPKTRIVVMKVFPRGLNNEPYRDKINKLNALLTAECRGLTNVTLLDIGPRMMKDGELNTSLYRDNCHLNENGYAVWSEALEAIFKEEGL